MDNPTKRDADLPAHVEEIAQTVLNDLARGLGPDGDLPFTAVFVAPDGITAHAVMFAGGPSEATREVIRAFATEAKAPAVILMFSAWVSSDKGVAPSASPARREAIAVSIQGPDIDDRFALADLTRHPPAATRIAALDFRQAASHEIISEHMSRLFDPPEELAQELVEHIRDTVAQWRLETPPTRH